MAYVRWLGAFVFHRENHSLYDSIRFESTRNAGDEVACEKISMKYMNRINHTRVGLLVDRTAIVKFYKGDVWSRYKKGTHKLMPTRSVRHKKYDHTEAFAKARYTGIVLNNVGLENITKGARYDVIRASKEFHLPVYIIDKHGALKEVEIK